MSLGAGRFRHHFGHRFIVRQGMAGNLTGHFGFGFILVLVLALIFEFPFA
jgi:hypothetical protein